RIIEPDLVLRRGGSKVVVEIKRGTPGSLDSTKSMGRSQVLSYLVGLGAKNGILYIAPFNGYTELRQEPLEVKFIGGSLNLITLYPIRDPDPIQDPEAPEADDPDA